MKYKFRFSVQFFENVSIVSPLTYMGIAWNVVPCLKCNIICNWNIK
jgi:hypothetical protein